VLDPFCLTTSHSYGKIGLTDYTERLEEYALRELFSNIIIVCTETNDYVSFRSDPLCNVLPNFCCLQRRPEEVPEADQTSEYIVQPRNVTIFNSCSLKNIYH
jgi:hypothetical protein